jgi:hypothetical protein
MDLTNFSSTSLGYLMAYFLPGFASLYAVSLHTRALAPIASKFAQSQAGLGLFLVATLAALGAGLIVSSARWLLFEQFICRAATSRKNALTNLKDSNVLTTFRMIVDEKYRYHQFYGAMALVVPWIAWAYCSDVATHASTRSIGLAAAAAAVLELLLVAGAVDTYSKYVTVWNQVLP